MALNQQFISRLPQSQFLNEMSIPSESHTEGLSNSEATTIISDVNNL